MGRRRVRFLLRICKLLGGEFEESMNMTIPIGNVVVTVHVDKVDRSHTDPKRFVN